ncbi:MAG TPA: glycosyltransferase N-terminal domain-containing protein [Acetobacteraceae bacterium]|jgi:3-deoxy-D-manno-octulosonic-acid transferase|nr:glycosyltransferase N-terminal domain-containing protein [Acetobacteraceae bacterium]
MSGALPAALWAGSARLAAPALRLWLRRRLAAGKERPGRLAERSGRDPTPRPGGKLLWLHAASVGEIVSVLPLIKALGRQDKALNLLVTTGTVTSASLLLERLPALGLGERARHRFVPLDVPGWVGRFLDHWRPDAAAFVESELWPNLIAAAAARRIPLALLNARLSERSFARWRLAPGFARRILGAFSLVAARSEEDAARLSRLGASDVSAPGDLKLAAEPLPVDEGERGRLANLLGTRPRWLAASTHPGEEAVAAEIHRRLRGEFPGLVTIIAPRHPERGMAIAAALADLAPIRRAAGGDPPQGGIFLADTLGELGLLYRLAPIVFVGRSLAGRGGQNPLEPARLGCAIAVGPHTENFSAAVTRLEAVGGIARISDAAALASWVAAMLHAPERVRQMGEAARAAAEADAMLPDRLAASLLSLLDR